MIRQSVQSVSVCGSKKFMNTVTLMIVVVYALTAPRWTVQTSGVTARLRGVSAVSERVAWASGSGATVLRTTDGGATWQKLTVQPKRSTSATSTPSIRKPLTR